MSSRVRTPMNLSWEETVRRMQSDPSNRELLRNTYLDTDLQGNAERYAASAEFREILDVLNGFGLKSGRLLDVGAGNGICSVAFARSGWEVTALEPDDSAVTGRQAILALKKSFALTNLHVVSGTGEHLPFQTSSFDVVFVRQAFHHAADLKAFAHECLRILAPDGLLLGIREHVILDSADKALFLDQHPMHKYYGGENAYRLDEYTEAFRSGGGQVERILSYYDSIINYFPLTADQISALPDIQRKEQRKRLRSLLGPLAQLPFIDRIYAWYVRLRIGGPYDERRLPGRMYSFIVRKTTSDRSSSTND